MMTPAEEELIATVMALAAGVAPEGYEKSRARQRAAVAALSVERLGPMLPEIRACIRRQLEAQKQLRQYHSLPGFGGENGACLAIWREVEAELGMRDENQAHPTNEEAGRPRSY
jgi:hypothetical protein